MNPVMRCLVERLHSSQARCSIISAGAGGSAASSLMAVPGCSSTLIDAHFPYHDAVTSRLLDYRPVSYVSEKVSASLAQAAFHQCEGASFGINAIGIGATAAISTNRIRRGADAAFVSCWTGSGVKNYSLRFSARDDRAIQEDMVARTILLATAEGARVKINDLKLGLPEVSSVFHEDLSQPQLVAHYTPHRRHPLDALIAGDIEAVTFNRHGSPKVANFPPYQDDDVRPEEAHYLLYPGSFNPLHWGHTELARTATTVVQNARDQKCSKRPVVLTYEVAISRVGKQDLSRADLANHVEQFTLQGHRIAMTTAKLFVDKARLFPNHGLLVGIDTVVRVLDKQYYGNSFVAMIEAMKQIRSHNCYFVVGGRVRGDEWVDLSGVTIPDEIRDMFIPIPKELFRVDISSTEIRKRRLQSF